MVGEKRKKEKQQGFFVFGCRGPLFADEKQKQIGCENIDIGYGLMNRSMHIACYR